MKKYPKSRFWYYCRLCERVFEAQTPTQVCSHCQGKEITLNDNQQILSFILPQDKEKYDSFYR